MLGADGHAIADDLCARGLGLGHALDLDEAGPTGGNRLEQWVIAESRDLHTDQLRGPDGQGSLGHLHLDAINGDTDSRDHFSAQNVGHRATAPAKT